MSRLGSAQRHCLAPPLYVRPRLRVTIFNHIVARGLGSIRKLDALLDVGDELGDAGVEQLLLLGGDRAERQDLLDAVGTELDVGREEIGALVGEQRRDDVAGLDDALPPASASAGPARRAFSPLIARRSESVKTAAA
jgi:hypothetical protein